MSKRTTIWLFGIKKVDVYNVSLKDQYYTGLGQSWDEFCQVCSLWNHWCTSLCVLFNDTWSLLCIQYLFYVCFLFFSFPLLCMFYIYIGCILMCNGTSHVLNNNNNSYYYLTEKYGFLTYIAAKHQGAMKMLWFQFRCFLMSSTLLYIEYSL